MSAPDAPRERKLPFKRTVKRKSNDASDNTPKPVSDGIDLFRRSGALFDKPSKMTTPQPIPEIRKQLLGESKNASSRKARRHSTDRDQKRQCISLSDSEDESGGRPSTQKSPRKSSKTPLDRSPAKFRDSMRNPTSTPTRTRSTQAAKAPVNVIALDSSDDEDYKQPQSRAKAKETMRDSMSAEEASVIQQQPTRIDDSDTDSDLDPPIEPDTSQSSQLQTKFQEEVRERMRKEQLARAANSAAKDSPRPQEVVEIFIESRLEGTMNMRVRVNLFQKMGMVKQSWVGYNQKKKMPISESVLNEMFFTWRGNKLYEFTTLASLDIKRNGDGQLYSNRESKREGFEGWDKVHIEAWTPELFDDYQRNKDRERRRQLGDLVDDEPEPEPEPEPVEKVASIKIILKSKDNGSQNLTVPMNVEVAKLSLAFRKVKKIPDERDIVLNFDGEALDEDSTIDEIGIEDMDSIEVHIK
ncbi:ubiquitin-2 like Rad60 SUMO-like-domain-containing protein [Apiospora arundinis]